MVKGPPAGCAAGGDRQAGAQLLLSAPFSVRSGDGGRKKPPGGPEGGGQARLSLPLDRHVLLL